MELPLVVGVDGSASSLRATDWAVDHALRHGLALRLVNASLWERYEVAQHRAERPSGEIAAENIVAAAAERARYRNPDLKISTEVVREDPVRALLQEAEDASALVLGSHGRGEVADLLLGSVGLAVAARAHCPVIIVRGDDFSVRSGHGHILLGVGDRSAPAAVHFAFREAEARRCTLDAVRAWRTPALETLEHPLEAAAGHPRSAAEHARLHENEASARLDEALREAAREHPGVRVRRATVEGPARKVLVRRSAAADLLIVGAQRRPGHLGLQLGVVGHAVLHHAECPVAVVPQPA
ncbi:universal stress protein [Streptomyces jeddahensis]|nr:universal stress protein [Streptomyces jeddahensis]